ncbi:hypothetical protein SEA_VARDY_4 [Gordonia phage Vardy]|nr:hypothetical protein SEA_NADMEG_4 [Gordonia phage Nadmeg]UVK63969.1 hypothetical protein SEA_VARDY_4 [Gordonia phage Vardy]
MSSIRARMCGDPGPYTAHCTEPPGHRFSCYDAGEDVSFNHRQDFDHDCHDPNCPRQKFTNEGD